MKRTTPFKASDDFEKELIDFSRQFKTLIADHSKRISDYFEMSCYNLVIPIACVKMGNVKKQTISPHLY